MRLSKGVVLCTTASQWAPVHYLSDQAPKSVVLQVLLQMPRIGLKSQAVVHHWQQERPHFVPVHL